MQLQSLTRILFPSPARVAFAITTVGLLAVAAGCGGGFSSQPAPPPVAQAGAYLSARVVLAGTNPPQPVPGALVTATDVPGAAGRATTQALTNASGVAIVSLPHPGTFSVTVSSASLLATKPATVTTSGTQGTAVVFSVTAVPPATQIAPGSSATVQDAIPNNPSSAGLTSASVSFPTGGNAGGLSISVVSTPPLGSGEWLSDLETSREAQVPLSPQVNIIVSSSSPLEQAIPANAQVNVPSLLPRTTTAGQTVTVDVGTSPTNVGVTSVPGILQADGTALVNLKASFDALVAAGLGPSLTRDETPFQIVLELAPDQVTLPSSLVVVDPAQLESVAQTASNCNGTSDLEFNLQRTVDSTLTATVNGNPEPALLNYLETALSVPADNAVTLSVVVPIGQTVSATPAFSLNHFNLNLQIPGISGPLQIQGAGSWKVWSLASTLTACPTQGTGSVGTRSKVR